MADETIRIGVEIEGEEKLKSLKDAANQTGKATKGLDKDMDDLGKTFEDVYGDMQPMTTRLGELEDRMYEMAAAGEAGTKQFSNLQKEAVRLRKTIKAVDQQVDAAAEGGRNLNNALALSSSVVAGYQGFASVTALLGVEQEELMQTMVKLQAAEGALQSIQQVSYTIQQNRVGITNALGKAQGAYNMVVGQGTNAIMGTSKSQAAMNDAMVEGMKAASGELLALEDLSREIDSNKQSRDDIVQSVKDFQEEHPELLKGLVAEEATMTELNDAIAKQTKLTKLLAFEKALQAKREEIYSKIIEEQLLLTTQQNVGIMDYAGALIMGGNAQNAANIQSLNAIKNNEELLRQLNQMSDATKGQIRLLEEVPDKYAAEKRARYESRVEAEKKSKANKQLKQDYKDLSQLAIEYAEQQRKEIDLTKEWRDNAVEDVGEVEEINLIPEKGLFPVEGLNHELTNWEQFMSNIRQLNEGTASSMVSQFGGAFGSIAQLFEQNSKAQKSFAIASIIANTAESLMKAVPVALEASKATGPAAPFIFAGTLAGIIGTVAAAAAQAKQVLSSAPGGGASGGGGGSISAPTTNVQSRSEQQAPQLSLFGQGNEGASGGSNQFESVTPNQGQGFKAYVVQSEIQAVTQDNAQYQTKSQL